MGRGGTTALSSKVGKATRQRVSRLVGRRACGRGEQLIRKRQRAARTGGAGTARVSRTAGLLLRRHGCRRQALRILSRRLRLSRRSRGPLLRSCDLRDRQSHLLLPRSRLCLLLLGVRCGGGCSGRGDRELLRVGLRHRPCARLRPGIGCSRTCGLALYRRLHLPQPRLSRRGVDQREPLFKQATLRKFLAGAHGGHDPREVFRNQDGLDHVNDAIVRSQISLKRDAQQRLHEANNAAQNAGKIAGAVLDT